jgi:hypothetical protein
VWGEDGGRRVRGMRRVGGRVRDRVCMGVGGWACCVGAGDESLNQTGLDVPRSEPDFVLNDAVDLWPDIVLDLARYCIGHVRRILGPVSNTILSSTKNRISCWMLPRILRRILARILHRIMTRIMTRILPRISCRNLLQNCPRILSRIYPNIYPNINPNINPNIFVY